jgi:5-oxoprolinase (ATP-hydrolysing)
MQSSGGTVGVDAASARPVSLLMSGPVAGLIGGIWAGRLAGFESVITLDMGGTSADIGVAPGGELRMRHLVDTAVAGYQAMVPMVDVDTIGAGGGSIAIVDRGGVFRVGPASAGADPGPACYGRGGVEPTSTDAQLLLGRLRPEGLLGGAMPLDEARAEAAMRRVAEPLGVPTVEASLGVLQIQKYGMTQAIELNSVRRGYDPRDFTLVAAGGAGPLFACDIALELEIPRVLVPPHPGITSATGLLATDVVHELVATAMQRLARLDAARLEAQYAGLERQALAQLAEEGYEGERALVTRLADCRYAGQGYEVRVRVPGGPIDGEGWVERCVEAFHLAHEAE